MPGAHAILAPSSANRWLNCTPSARINAAAPQRDTAFTREGTVAHAVAEAKARQYFLDEDQAAEIAAQQIECAKLDEEFPGELDGWQMMNRVTDEYLEDLKQISLLGKSKAFVMLEERIDFSEWAPEGFGRADCIMIYDDVLHVVDFKYGKGHAVDPTDNPQMKLYALGAYAVFADTVFDINTVRMSIIQPRVSSEYSTFEISAKDLLAWANETVKPAAELAFKGEGDFNPGDWCLWCANSATCRKRAVQLLSLADRFGKKPGEQLTAEEIGEALREAKNLAKWASELEEYALQSALNGDEIPGYKAVEGRKTRVWSDPKAAFEHLVQTGVEEAMLYERKPLTLAAIEKMVGKKQFEKDMKGYWEFKSSKPTLVEDSDKRPAISNRTTAAEDFGFADAQ